SVGSGAGMRAEASIPESQVENVWTSYLGAGPLLDWRSLVQAIVFLCKHRGQEPVEESTTPCPVTWSIPASLTGRSPGEFGKRLLNCSVASPGEQELSDAGRSAFELRSAL